jgi:hypothetical protein
VGYKELFKRKTIAAQLRFGLRHVKATFLNKTGLA